MKVNIHGRTEATITFNTLGITLRGNDPSELGSIARGIDLVDEHQISEVRGIERIGLIRVEEIEDGKKVITTREAIDRAEEDYLRAVEAEKQAEEDAEEQAEEDAKEVDNSEGPIDPKKEPSVKERRRKPKKKTAKKETKEEDEEVQVKPFDEPDNSTVVVMTSTGPKRNDMVHDMRGEIDENEDRCKASMDAARELEEEENAEPEFIDESLLDPSERMGSDAVIGTGGGKSATIAMKNSAFGEKPDPNFLDDLDLDDEEEVEEPKAEKVDSAFIDDESKAKEDDIFIDDESAEDELGDAFIEI
jgi:fused signal recognition particle receptor